MAAHRQLGAKLQAERYARVTDVTDWKSQAISGVLILIKKELWTRVGGFKEGTLGVDNDIMYRTRAAGERICLMEGVYMYHWYRAGIKENKKHLL